MELEIFLPACVKNLLNSLAISVSSVIVALLTTILSVIVLLFLLFVNSLSMSQVFFGFLEFSLSFNS